MLDADGVLQLIGTPWKQALRDAGGAEFAHALLAEEWDALCGRESLTTLLERLVARLRLAATVESLLALWYQAVPDPGAWQLVAELRGAGYTTVLATNQQHERRQWMRETLGYRGRVDIEGYSCTLGVAKPRPEYFTRLLEESGSEPGQALFVDDNADNVATARALGIHTVHHRADSGGQVLRQEVVAALTSGS
ncbi:HAD family hydrolase [Actinomyces wuliandei]|uniref:HAD family hydrolase n=1 Tax=Actinomyces wuliandei TaxID=2057743 RepID=UPI001FAA1946|nr:HAD-IA family hydrolase [Actinomyces wuliandei]